jgi:hypothetical protein
MYKLLFKNDYDTVVIIESNTIVSKGSYDYGMFEKWMSQGNTPQQPQTIPAMTQLRWKRNMLLAQSDIPWGLSDYTHPDKQSWLDYRQALRDLTTTSNPELDENDNVINVNWPVIPNANNTQNLYTANT